MGEADETTTRISVTLDAELSAVVAAAIASGRYADAGEIVAEALRQFDPDRALTIKRLAELENSVRIGLAAATAGDVHPLDDVIADLHAEIEAFGTPAKSAAE